ncbi:MAG: FKBP-type peptidyl-prolyl cis-trans isomerase [Candidatus Dormiibacterota bacterium]
MGARWNLGIRLALPGALLSLALVLTGCGGSLDSGVTPTSSPQTPATASTSPTATPSPTASASACVSPGDTEATYQLPGAKVLAGDLQIKDTTVGTGAKAKAGDTIEANYVGSLPDGTVFGSSSKAKPFSSKLSTSQVIAGWVEGIPGMRVGGTRELVLPAALAYGCTAYGKVPADSTLIFKITLLKVS